jgi:hypothetical protein
VIEFVIGWLAWLLWQVFLFCLWTAPVYTLVLVFVALAPYPIAFLTRKARV